MTTPSPFDAEGNVVGDDRPVNYRTYWAGLSDTERAFETLAGTDAALYMQMYMEVARMQRRMIEPLIRP